MVACMFGLLIAIYTANAQDFTPHHADCWNVYGEDTGVLFSPGRKAALYEGFQLPEVSRITLASGGLVSVTTSMRSNDDQFPIPDECFDGAGELGKHGAHYDLIPCAAGRQPEDMLRICMTVCLKVPGCIGAEYDEFFTGLHHCHLHAELGDTRLSDPNMGVQLPKCAHAPSRFLCSDRKNDEWLGIWCPQDRLPAYKYSARDKGAPAPSVQPPTWTIGGSMVLSGDVACNCDDALREAWILDGNRVFCATEGVSLESQRHLGDSLEAIFGSQKARIECSMSAALAAPRALFVYYLELQPGLSPDDIHGQIDAANCDNDGAALPNCGTGLTGDISIQMQDRMTSVTVVSFGLSSWTVEGYRNAVFQEHLDCVTDGQLTGFGISPNHYSMIVNNINFLPEEHAGTEVFLKSMSDPLDWFPIPDGCFLDTEVDGSPSNPALVRFGRHFELLGPDCLGNRTENEMMRICLTICSHIDYGESAFLDGEVDKEIDMRCIGANYDEHGDKGHCHLYTQFDIRIYGSQSSMCDAVRGTDHNDICTELDQLTPRTFCPTVGLPSLGSPSCGVNNTLGIFCHFNTLTCVVNGYHAMGVELLTDDMTDIIPHTVPIQDEEFRSPLFGMPGGAGRDGACKQCAATTYSSRVIKNHEYRTLIPAPADYPDTVNVCKPCPEGRECRQGIGCSWGHDPQICPPRCPPGQYCPPAVDEGIPCRVNYYQDLDGQGSCKMCPTGFTFNLGSDSLDFCMCPNGMRRKSISNVSVSSDDEPCTPCLEGMICEWDGPAYIESAIQGQTADYAGVVNSATNFQTIPHLSAGYWADVASPIIVYKCDATLANEDCLGGSLIPQRAMNSTAAPLTQCRGRTEGRLCNMCPDGYMKDVNAGGCVECGPTAWLPLVLVLLAGAFAFLVFYAASSKIIAVQRLAQTKGPKGLDMGIAMVLLGRVVQTIQLLSIFSVLSIPWPSTLKQALDSTKFIKLDLNGLQIGCMVGQSAVGDFLGRSIFIMLIVLFLPICFGISKVLPGNYNMSGAVTLHVCGTILTVLFLSFTTVGFSPFVCLEHPATAAGTTMAMYPHVECWQGEHVGMVVIGLSVLMSQLASLGFIGYACFMLPKYSVNAKKRAEAMVSVKFVYGNYKADVWFYSFLMLMRNLVTAFVPAISPNNPGIQLAIMTQSLICSFALHCYLWPWHMPVANAMDFMSLSCVLSLAVLAAAWLPRSDNQSFFVGTTEAVMSLAIMGGMAVSFISLLLMTPYSKKNPTLAKIGVQMHLMGDAPEVEPTAEMIRMSSSTVASKTQAQIVATVKDLDAYDKRRLVFMAKFLDTEFANLSATSGDAPKAVRRIKSTASLGGDSLETPVEPGKPCSIITV